MCVCVYVCVYIYIYIYIYIYYCVHLLVNVTDLLGLLKKCRCNGQLCALDEKIGKYFEISLWIQDGLNVLRTLEWHVFSLEESYLKAVPLKLSVERHCTGVRTPLIHSYSRSPLDLFSCMFPWQHIKLYRVTHSTYAQQE